MASSHLINNIWLAQLVCQAALGVVLVKKRVWREFPLFTAYSAWNLLDGLTKYVLYSYFFHQTAKLYFYLFWIGEGLSVILGIAIVYEVFRHLFSVHSALRKLAGFSFVATIAVLVAIGGSVFYGPAPVGLHHLGSATLLAEEAARILEVGLLMFLFLFAGAFGLHWRQPVFGISMGLGIFAAVELINMVLRSRLGADALNILNVVRMMTYNSSLVLWLVYLVAPERATNAAAMPSRTQLEQWNEAIGELIHQ
jgi:hypothetical protein